MIDTPTVVQSEAATAAVIRLTIPKAEMRDVMGSALHEVLDVALRQGIGPAGPVFSHHLRLDPDVFDLIVGVPVTAPVQPAGRVVEGELPAATVVRTVYHGPYEGLPAAWGEFDAWIAGSDHALRGDLWERYVAGPESGDDPAQWQTELNRPLAT